MSKKVKLENFVVFKQSHEHNGIEYSKFAFCPICGQSTGSIIMVEECCCEACRHQINLMDSFCNFCGASLSEDLKKEHYMGGIALDEVLFTVIKKEIEKRNKDIY